MIWIRTRDDEHRRNNPATLRQLKEARDDACARDIKHQVPSAVTSWTGNVIGR